MNTYHNTSQISSTLFNPGGNTVFLYRLSHELDEKKCGEINNMRLFVDKVRAISDAGAELEFFDIKPAKRNPNRFRNNLLLIDCCLPQLLGTMLLYRYVYNLRFISEITRKLEENNPLGLDLSDNHNFYRAKIKRLLIDIALGMAPGKVWNDEYEANGGYLIVMESGDIVCYHLYDRQIFEDYLFFNTCLDTPDPHRYGFGTIEQMPDGRQCFSLNLQIRFGSGKHYPPHTKKKDKTMANECLICGKPLKFLSQAEEKECTLCHRKFMTNATCEDGHFVCDECHAASGIKSITDYAEQTASRNPIEIATEMMRNPYIYMHGNEHHVLVGAALLSAYRNSGGDIDLAKAVCEIEQRGKCVPGGACGFWGACGAGISSGMFISIVTGATPIKNKEWGLSNLMTAESLRNIGEIGGPRCCKRNTYTAIKTAVKFCADNLGVRMELPDEIVCTFSDRNRQCIGSRCPYSKKLK